MTWNIQKDKQGYADFLIWIDREMTGRPDLWVNTQYSQVVADDQALIPADTEALILACRSHTEPQAAKPAMTTTSKPDTARNLCPRCHTYCFGDCSA